MALLRHLTNKAIMLAETLSPAHAWAKCQEFLALPEVQYWGELDGLEEQWQTFSNMGQTSANMWTDAYLAAFAKCSQSRLVTFDLGFRRFPGLEIMILTLDGSLVPEQKATRPTQE